MWGLFLNENIFASSAAKFQDWSHGHKWGSLPQHPRGFITAWRHLFWRPNSMRAAQSASSYAVHFMPILWRTLVNQSPVITSSVNYLPSTTWPTYYDFLPRCMECSRGLAMRILSVRLSVKRVYCDKTEERSVPIFIP